MSNISMNICSMTGFGKAMETNDQFEVVAEIKSVNHRFKDLRFRMSNLFNSIELELRKELEGKFKRGSFDISINYRKQSTSGLKANIDYDKVNAFISEMKNSTSGTDVNINIQPTDFLRSEFYQEDEDKQELLHQLSKKAFNNALDKLSESRENEGQKLGQMIIKHRQNFESSFSIIKELRKNYEKEVKSRLTKKFEEEDLSRYIEEPRFVQEVIFYLEKLDVDEELNRIDAHLGKLDELLNNKKKEIGRELDFVLQELNRETNTIGSKSGIDEISQAVIKMKVELEKMREQALNIE